MSTRHQRAGADGGAGGAEAEGHRAERLFGRSTGSIYLLCCTAGPGNPELQ